MIFIQVETKICVQIDSGLRFNDSLSIANCSVDIFLILNSIEFFCCAIMPEDLGIQQIFPSNLYDTLPEVAGYGEWRFIQVMANVSNGIKDGTWLDATRGFHHFEVSAGMNNQKQIQIVFYNGH
jgi:hypothetical protein